MIPNFMQYARLFVDHMNEPTQYVQTSSTETAISELGRQLWRELFLSVSTESDLSTWREKIPRYGCSCSDFYAAYERDNPPTFPLTFRWKYDLKTAVNAKLSHPNLSYEDALAFWNVADRSADHS